MESSCKEDYRPSKRDWDKIRLENIILPNQEEAGYFDGGLAHGFEKGATAMVKLLRSLPAHEAKKIIQVQ